MRDIAWFLGAACLVATACGDDSAATGSGGGGGGTSSSATGDTTVGSSGATTAASGSTSSSKASSGVSSGGDGGNGAGGEGTGANGTGGEGTGANGTGGEGTGANGTGGSGTGANGTGGSGTGGDGTGGSGTGGDGTGGSGTGGDGTGGGGDERRLFVPGDDDFLRQNNAALPATVSDFYLDRDELTVARFRTYVATLDVAEQAALSLRFAACNDATWTDIPGTNENLPINCIARAEGAPACEAVGGRLPTELEWNYAAAGGDEQRVFPWSDPPDSADIDGTRAVYSDSGDDGIQPVGSKPAGAGRFGHLDLAGNVWEMVADSDNSTYISQLTCDDCSFTGLASEPRYIRRGGNVDSASNRLRNDARDGDSDDQDADIGVRCAYDSP